MTGGCVPTVAPSWSARLSGLLSVRHGSEPGIVALSAHPSYSRVEGIGMSVQTAQLKTTGMHCPSCSMLVDMTLADIDGVVDSKTDHVTGVTVVSFDADKTSVDAFVDAIRGVGYDAELSA